MFFIIALGAVADDAPVLARGHYDPGGLCAIRYGKAGEMPPLLALTMLYHGLLHCHI